MALSRPCRLLLRAHRRPLPPSARPIAAGPRPSHHAAAAALARLPSTVDPLSDEFLANERAMKTLTAHLADLTGRVHRGGPESARARHLARNKTLPRDRVAALLDPGTTFLELSPLAGHDLYPGADVPAGGIITGVGLVEGVRCLVVANDSTVKGGTYYPVTVKKHLRAQAVAEENKLPCIYLVDSGGANLPHQADVFPDAAHFGRIFYNQARMSAQGIPQISVVMGPCTAGGAYVPAMSDETIIVANQGHVFLAGPPLVRAATGEHVSAEDLGGGHMHASVSGVADYLAVDDAHAIALARRSVANLNYPSSSSSSSSPSSSPPPYLEPLHPQSHLLGLAPTNLRKPPPIRDIIARLVDASLFAEFKPAFGTTLVTGFATLHGHKVGILANDGILFSSSALKGAHFIQLCTQRRIPLVFLQNISGFMVGSASERDGLAKHGAKLVTAVACANVPKFTVVIGGSYGAGNYGMCGRAYSPRFLWMWPNARVGVMGADQLAAVMETVRGSSSSSQGQTADSDLRARIERETEAIYSSARLWDDGIIPPQHTRHYLGLGLQAAMGGRNDVGAGDTKFGVFRM